MQQTTTHDEKNKFAQKKKNKAIRTSYKIMLQLTMGPGKQ